MRLEDVDLTDLDRFVDEATPWRMFDTLRREAPVHWQPERDGAGFWAVTRHADIIRVLRDEATFSSQLGGSGLEELDERQLDVRRSMLETDGPRHRALRGLLQRDFTPRSVAQFGTFLHGLVGSTLDAALAKNEFDFVTEIAADFPIRALARMLGVPEADTGQLIAWGNRMIGNTDPEYADVLHDSAASEAYRDLPFRSPAALEVFAYGRELARQRSRRGGGATARGGRRAGRRHRPDRAGCCTTPPTASRWTTATSGTTSCCWSWPATRPPGTPSRTP